MSRLSSVVNVKSRAAHANEQIAEYDMYELSIPWIRQPPTRYTGQTETYIPPSDEEHYRAASYTVIDYAVRQMRERFSIDDARTGRRTYLQLEETLLSGRVFDICKSYPELNDLTTQLTGSFYRNCTNHVLIIYYD